MSAEDALRMEQDDAARALARRRFAGITWIEAGAGTGKTAVLVARIVVWCLTEGWQRNAERLQSEPPRVGAPDLRRVAVEVLQRVTAITFTEAAAAEMQQRVSAALDEVRRGKPPLGCPLDELQVEAALAAERAEALLGALDHLAVSTIHAFCRRLLASYVMDAGLHPRFAVDADESGLAAIAREVIEAQLLVAYEGGGESDLFQLALRGFTPANLEEALRVLLREGVAPSELAELLSPDSVAAFCAGLRAALADFAAAEAGALQNLPRSPAVQKLVAALAGLHERLVSEPPRDRTGLAALADFCEQQIGERDRKDRLPKWNREDFGKAGREALGEAAPRAAQAAGAVRRHLELLAALDVELLLCGARALSSLLREAQQLALERGVQSYGALLRDASHLLQSSPEVAAQVRAGMDQLLVDEFQDTDPLQCDLLRAIALPTGAGSAAEAARPGLFLVGDPKQSIYGWRNADLKAYDDFRKEVSQFDAEFGELVVNYRSVKPILDEVSCVIAPHMQERAGLQPGFQRLIAHGANAEAPGFTRNGRRAVEHWFSGAEALPSPDSPAAAARSVEATRSEARAIASELRELHDAGHVKWCEVGILARSTGDFDVFLDALRRAGIPYAVERDRGYYERREITDATALLRAILDPHDQLALVAALRSAAVAVPDAALRPLWRAGFSGAFAALHPGAPQTLEAARSAVQRAAEQMPQPAEIPGLAALPDWTLPLDDFLCAVCELRGAFLSKAPDLFVERFRTRLLIEAAEAGRALAAWRLANLDRFFRDLTHALAECGGDVSAVLSRLRQAVNERREQEEGRPRDAARDAVQVMTIHKAKGLDFNHVFVVQLHKGRGRDLSRAPQVRRRGDQMGLQFFGQRSLSWPAAAAASADLEEAESVRTLYVAMTRAKQRLVLAGSATPRSSARHAQMVAKRRSGLCQRLLQSAPAAAPKPRSEVDGVLLVLPKLFAPAQPPPPAAPPAPLAERKARWLRDAQQLAAQRKEAALHAKRSLTGNPSGRENFDEQLAESAELDGAPGATGAAARKRAMEAGTAMHAALETLDFSLPLADWRDALTQRLAELHGADAPESARTLQPELLQVLQGFLESDLPRRLQSLAPHILARELPLMLAPQTTKPDEPLGLWSGAADLLYRDPESGEIVVADYKTDDVPAAAVAERARNYAGQGRLYTLAVQRALALGRLPRFELWFLRVGVVVG